MAGPEAGTESRGLEILTIDDFTPGIWRDVYGKQNGIQARGPAPDGAAIQDRTYACASMPQGGLTGGPKILSTVEIDAERGDGYTDFEPNEAGDTINFSQTRPIYADPTGAASNQLFPDLTVDQPEIEDVRLSDFEVIGSASVGNSYWGTIEPTVIGAAPFTPPGQIKGLDGELTQGAVLAPQWQSNGIHNPGGAIAQSGSRHNGDDVPYQMSVMNIQFFPREHYDGTASPTDPIVDIYRWCPIWVYPENSSIHDSQKSYGYGVMVNGFWLYNPDVEDNSQDLWKMGTPCIFTNITHVSSGSWEICYNPNTTSPASNVPLSLNNGNNVIAIGAIDPEWFGCWGLPLEFRNNYYTHHMVVHAGRLVRIIAPTSNYYQSYAGNGYDITEAFDNANVVTTQPAARGSGGMLFRSDEGGGEDVAVMNNSRLHYSYPQILTPDGQTGPESGWKTGLYPGKVVQSLSDEGFNIINSMTSVNANQLFMTTTNKGAVVINGDLNNPSVVNLPAVESTYGKTPHPVAVNGGVVYGSRSGMYLWDGGEASQHLSSQLEGEFWLSDDMEDSYRPAAPVGRLGYRAPYLFAPNGWMCDMRSNSWWRVPGPDNGDWTNEEEQWTHYRTDHDGYVWATGARQVADLDAWKFTTLDPDETTDQWQWHSQPLTISRNRSINLREVNVWMIGSDMTMRVYMNGSLQGQEQVITAKSTTYPRLHTFDFNITGENIELEIEAGAELVVYKIDVGWRQGEIVPASNTTAVTA